MERCRGDKQRGRVTDGKSRVLTEASGAKCRLEKGRKWNGRAISNKVGHGNELQGRQKILQIRKEKTADSNLLKRAVFIY